MYRGIVEGFYGRPFGDGRRKVLLEYISRLEEPAYVYAPKNDPYHRIEWRRRYPPGLWNGLAEDMSFASGVGVDFIFGISPWGFMDGESALLRAKAESAMEAGAAGIAVLFDDVPERPDGDLAKRQLEFAGEALGSFRCPVFVCPSVYCMEFLEKPDGRNYLDSWKEYVPRSWHCFWTGEEVVSGRLDAATIERARSLLGTGPAVWDNIPANDYCLRRIFLSSLDGRVPEGHHYFLNPPECFPAALFVAWRLLSECGIYEWAPGLGDEEEPWDILSWFHWTPWSPKDAGDRFLEKMRKAVFDDPEPGFDEEISRIIGLMENFLVKLERLPWGYELFPYVRDLMRMLGWWKELSTLRTPEERVDRLKFLAMERLPMEHPLACLVWDISMYRREWHR